MRWLRNLFRLEQRTDAPVTDPNVVQSWHRPVDVRVFEHPPGEFEAQFTIRGSSCGFISIDDRTYTSLEKAQDVCRRFAARQEKMLEPGRVHEVR